MMMIMMEEMTTVVEAQKVPDGIKKYSSIKELENCFHNSREKQEHKFACDKRMKNYGY